jgi:uncharacterized membrane protein
MNKSLSIALLAVGVVLTVYGVSAADSVTSGFSRLFTGAPTDKAVWLLVVGLVAGIAGLVGLFRGAPRSR